MRFLLVFLILLLLSCLEMYELPLNDNAYLHEINKSKNAEIIKLTFKDWNKRFSRDSMMAYVNNAEWQKCLIAEIGNTNERSHSFIVIGKLRGNRFNKGINNKNKIEWLMSNDSEYTNFESKMKKVKNDFGVIDGNLVILTKIVNGQYSIKLIYGRNDRIYKLISE